MSQAYEPRPVIEPGFEERPHAHPARHAPAAPISLGILRIGAGLLYMQHGAQKLFGLFGGMGPQHPTVPLVSQMGLAGVLEFFGGLLITIGLGTRFVAPLLAIEMIWAYFQVHMPRGGAPIQNGGELPLLFALIFIALSFLGAGGWSIDRPRVLRDRGFDTRAR
jgi:putative oxidoreductase